MTLHAENRQRLLARFAAIEGLPQAGSVILLQGGVSFTRDATDHEPVFRQESFFQWAFGVKEPDCFGALDLTTKKSTLFFPRLPESYVVWMGHVRPRIWPKLLTALPRIHPHTHFLSHVFCKFMTHE